MSETASGTSITPGSETGVKRVLLNSATGAVGLFLSTVVAFFVTPVVVHGLGNLDYGAWEIILSVFSYLALLDLGVNPAVVRFVARAAAIGDRPALLTVFSSAMLFGTVIGLVGMAAVIVLAMFPNLLLNLSSMETRGVHAALAIMSLNIAITFPGMVIVDVLMGFQKHYLVNSVRTIRLLLQSLGVYIAMKHVVEFKLVWMAGITTACSLAHYLTVTLYLLRSNPELRFTRASLSMATMRDLYGFGFKSMGLMAAQRIEKQSLPILIGWILGPAQVIFFVLPNRLLEYAYSLSHNLGMPISAHFSELDGRADTKAMRDSWFGLSRMLQFVIFGVSVALFFLGEAFLNVWLGGDYGTRGRWIIRILSLTFFIEGIAPNAPRLLIACGKHGRAAAISIVAAVLSLGLGGVLAWKIGLIGIALSVLISRAVVLCWLFAMALRIIEVPPFLHVKKTVARFVMPVTTACILLVLFQLRWPLFSYQAIVMQGMVAGLAYTGLCWLLALERAEKGRILAIVKIRRPESVDSFKINRGSRS